MAGKLNLKIDQGATFRQLITWKAGKPAVPVDLTGCTARMQVRESQDSLNVLHEMTTEDGGITLGDELGTVSLFIEASITTLFAWPSGVYDLEVVFTDGTVRRLVEGRVQVSPEVTRD